MTDAVKLLRTIRLDPSDTFIFAHVAEPGEWAVTGTFMFAQTDLSALEGKSRAAFRAGFLGIQSLGWSTLVQVVETQEKDRLEAIEILAGQFIERFGAPNMDAAMAAATEEFDFSASLCAHHPPDVLIALHRSHDDGDIREQFRALRPKGGPRSPRAFAFLEVEGEDEGPSELVDLPMLARQAKP